LGTLLYNFFVDEFLPNLIKENTLIQKGEEGTKKEDQHQTKK
jgi:hypothetical protein